MSSFALPGSLFDEGRLNSMMKLFPTSGDAHSKFFAPSVAGPPSKRAPTPACNGCGRAATRVTPLKTCAKCKQAQYCSKECQIGHWKCHKRDCKLIAATVAVLSKSASSP